MEVAAKGIIPVTSHKKQFDDFDNVSNPDKGCS